MENTEGAIAPLSLQKLRLCQVFHGNHTSISSKRTINNGVSCKLGAWVRVRSQAWSFTPANTYSEVYHATRSYQRMRES